MRKLATGIITLSMAGLMAVSMAGCGTSAKNSNTADATTQSVSATSEGQSQMSADFEKLMNDVMDETAEDAAKELETFVSTYAEEISYQSLEAAAADNFAAMLEENENNDFSAPYELKMEVIEQDCLEDDADLETDEAYCSTVNAIMSQLEVMSESLN